jgi:hypothetical protein
VGLDRAAGQEGAQPRGLGQRPRQPLGVARGDQRSDVSGDRECAA